MRLAWVHAGISIRCLRMMTFYGALLGYLCSQTHLLSAACAEETEHEPANSRTPAQEGIRKYRELESVVDGPILLSAVDIDPAGQFHGQYFVFGKVGHQAFGETLTTYPADSSVYLRATPSPLQGIQLRQLCHVMGESRMTLRETFGHGFSRYDEPVGSKPTRRGVRS